MIFNNKLFVSYQTLYSKGGFSPLLGVKAVAWINHTIMQPNSSSLLDSGRRAFLASYILEENHILLLQSIF